MLKGGQHASRRIVTHQNTSASHSSGAWSPFTMPWPARLTRVQLAPAAQESESTDDGPRTSRFCSLPGSLSQSSRRFPKAGNAASSRPKAETATAPEHTPPMQWHTAYWPGVGEQGRQTENDGSHRRSEPVCRLLIGRNSSQASQCSRASGKDLRRRDLHICRIGRYLRS